MNEDLLKGCRNNKRKAQEQLYHLYAPKVMGVCRRYASNKEDANDIFQEAFINIFMSLKKDKAMQINYLDAWIRKVSANTAVSYYHKNKKYSDHVSMENMIHHSDGQDFGQILSELGKKDLLNLIDQLPLGCKLVFNMYAIEGYSHKEIADSMNISVGTSKSQLSRAKSIIQSKVKKSDYVGIRFQSI